MKHFIFAALFAMCATASHAQVPQPSNGNFTCEITGAPAGANASACESQNIVNLIINNDLGCQAYEYDRYWIPNTAHGSSAKDLDVVWSISAPPGVTCTPPLSGVSTLGYTTDTLSCPGGSSEVDNPYDGSVRCYCPYQNVPSIGNLPGVYKGYPIPSCVPDTVYINPFYQPNSP